MRHLSLAILIKKLKSSPRVKGIFTTGTTATKLNPSSDIDLIVILDKNKEDLKSVYTIIDGHFSDIFFFDIKFLNQLNKKQIFYGNNFEGMFVEWLTKGKIEHDPENHLFLLKNKFSKRAPIQKISDLEKRDFWIKINYNFIANLRYYNSKNKLYHSALELRLLYSVIELITAYFSFRNIPWRGEKAAIKYLEQNDKKFLNIFKNYSLSSNLEKKMKKYKELFDMAFFGKYKKWNSGFVIPITNKNSFDQKLIHFWYKLTDSKN